MPPADGDLAWPEVSHDGVTEIFVHGVGGAAPAEMLDSLEVRQVTGDRISGMWRPRADVAGSTSIHREAYSWGGLTRRPLATALWLLLLPFALANVAGWMAAGRRRWAVRYQQSLVRVFSLLCTWTYVLFAAQMAMDLGAWQCVRVRDTCRIGGWWPDGYTPAMAAAVASLVPGLLVFLLWLTTHRSRGRYEDFFPDRGALPAGDLDIAEVSLDDKRLWSGRASSDHRMWLHLSSSILVIAILLAGIAGSGLLLAVTGGLLTLAVILAGADRFARLILKGLRGTLAALVAVALGGWAAVAAFNSPPPGKADAIMPGMLDAFNGVMVAAYAIIMLLYFAVWAAGGWKGRSVRGLLRAMPAQVVVLTLGTWLMFAVLSGTVITVARLLNPVFGPIGDTRRDALLYPAPYIPLARISIVGLLVVGLSALAHYLWDAWSPKARKRLQLDREKAIWASRPVDGLEPGDRKSWERRARAAIRRAEVIAWAETGIAVLTVLAVVASISYSIVFGVQWLGWEAVLRAVAVIVVAGLAFTAAALIADRRGPLSLLAILSIAAGVAAAVAIVMPALPLPALKPVPPDVDLKFLSFDNVTLALALLPAAVVLVLRKALQDRRTMGHLADAWDIVTFWPRAFHPMAPPSYAERAVPELTLRVTHILKDGQSVMLLRHSQGSVVAAAALAQLRDLETEQRQRISVVTYGSPLQSLYARWFPCYVNRETIEVRSTSFQLIGRG